MSTIVDAKRDFYRRPTIAAAYDTQRYGGSGGAFVAEREEALTAALLPELCGTAADVACGTGRLFELLAARSDTLIGLDTSPAMLQQVDNPDLAQGLVQADAFRLPLRDCSCDTVTCMRVLFHFPMPEPLLTELRRVTRRNGVLVCDTSTWSPRSALPLGRERWGEEVAPMPVDEFERSALACGWQVLAHRPAFFVSPYIYRLLPVKLGTRLSKMEGYLPSRLLCRQFWSLRAV